MCEKKRNQIFFRYRIDNNVLKALFIIPFGQNCLSYTQTNMVDTYMINNQTEVLNNVLVLQES